MAETAAGGAGRGGGLALEFPAHTQAAGKAPVHCAWSPSDSHLVAAAGKDLRVMDKETMRVAAMRACRHPVSLVEWSPDSTLVMAASLKAAAVQVFSVEDDKYKCDIAEGAGGMVHAFWAPDSRHILTVADFQIMITVWSLVDNTTVFLDSPKFPKAGMAFSHDGSYLAVATRRDCKDSICVYQTDTWALVRRFQTDTRDLADLSWSADDTALLVRDDPIVYKMLVYRMDGVCMAMYSAYEDALGIKTMAMSAASNLVAIGSFDDCVRLLSSLTWTPVAEFALNPDVDADVVATFTEVADEDLSVILPVPLADISNPEPAPRSGKVRVPGRRPSASSRLSTQPKPAPKTMDVASHFETMSGRYTAPANVSLKPSSASAPAMGVSTVKWSADDAFLAVRSDAMPKVLFVYEVAGFRLAAVLVFLNPVRGFAWDPSRSRLAVVTGTSTLYSWEPTGVSFVTIEEAFACNGVRWSASGSALLFLQRGHWQVGYLP